MKTRILLSIAAIGMVLGISAQKPSMTLTFTAENNGQHVPLTSVLIENLTQGGDTTLYASDTVLVLDYITGIEEVSAFGDNGFLLSQNYPNPMEGKTKVILYLPEKEDILITISDIIGRGLINKEYHLERGSHSFTFYPGRESLYFLTVQADHQSRTVKMFNSPSYSYSSGIVSLEYTGQHTDNGDYKWGNKMNNFVFSLGDQLKYTSFTDLGERIIIDSPAESKAYYFHYAGEPCPGTPTVTDIDGNIYNTVQIGSQCWMKENLKTTTYSDATPIPNVTDPTEWIGLNSGAYVWYDNDISWKDEYGALYNWFATVDPKGLCPTGWHVPSNDEWTELTNYIGGAVQPYGNELKSCRQVNSPLGGGCNTSDHPRWDEDITHYGTNDYGFSALPGGARDGALGNFYDLGNYGVWWSTTEFSFLCWARALSHDAGFVDELYEGKPEGHSVRCIQD